jgi:hypothetical protein
MKLRTLANTGLSVLLLITLLWGGCVSCSTYFMFPGSPAGCCNPSGHCKKTPQAPLAKNCTIQPMALAKVSGNPSERPELPMVGVTPLMPAVMPQAKALIARTESFFLPQTSPPDLNLLHSVLLI